MLVSDPLDSSLRDPKSCGYSNRFADQVHRDLGDVRSFTALRKEFRSRRRLLEGPNQEPRFLEGAGVPGQRTMISGRRHNLAGRDFPRNLVDERLPISRDPAGDVRRPEESLHQPRRGRTLVEARVRKARDESSSGPEDSRRFADWLLDVLHVHEGHVAGYDVEAGILQYPEVRGVGDVIDDAQRFVFFAGARPRENRGGRIDPHHLRARSCEPAREVAVPASEIEDAAPSNVSDDSKECGIDEGPMPQVPGVAL